MASLLNVGRGLVKMPYDAEIEYLESTGTQWIDLNVYGNLNTKVILRMCPKGNVGVVFGSRTNASTNNLSVMVGGVGGGSYNIAIFDDFGNYSLTRCQMVINTTDEDWYEVENGRYLRKIENLRTGAIQTQTYQYSTNFTTPQTLKIGLKTSGFPNGYVNYVGCVGICQIYNIDTLIFDGIPVRKGTTGYLYDKVSGQLFGNAGTGSFILGNDI